MARSSKSPKSRKPSSRPKRAAKRTKPSSRGASRRPARSSKPQR